MQNVLCRTLRHTKKYLPMHDLLLNLSIERLGVILISFLPALLNFSIFIYVRVFFPDYRVSRIFSLFLISLALWQLGETFMRMSQTEETAMLYNNIFAIGWLLITPIGLHFVLLFVEKEKYANSFWIQFLLYFPFLVFFIMNFLYDGKSIFIPSETWGWICFVAPNSHWVFEGYLMSLESFLMLGLLIHYAFKFLPNDIRRKQANIITIGFSLPIVQGITTEIILPSFEIHPNIPITSTVMTCFSIATLIALRKDGFFKASESLRLPIILGALTEIMIVLTPEGKLRFINKEGAKILGVNTKEKEDFDFKKIFEKKEYGDLFFSNLFLSVLNGKKIKNYSTELITIEQKKISVLISATTFKLSTNQTQILLLIRDVTGFMQTEHQLKEREIQLAEKTKELNTFFYHATHDLMSPVASILGLIELAKYKENGISSDEVLGKVGNSANQLNNLLNNLIKVIHLTERKNNISLIHFEELVNTAILRADQSLISQQVEIKVKIENTVSFFSDKDSLDVILYHLIVNAIQYKRSLSFHESYVQINVQDFENGIKIIVNDNGIGIDKSIQYDIYNIFFRGTELSKGSGIGLFLVKNAVTKLKGNIELESESAKGTTFTIYFPNLYNHLSIAI